MASTHRLIGRGLILIFFQIFLQEVLFCIMIFNVRIILRTAENKRLVRPGAGPILRTHLIHKRSSELLATRLNILKGPI